MLAKGPPGERGRLGRYDPLVDDPPARVWGSYGWGLLATLFWGLSFVGVRIALEGLTPFGLVWMRLGIGAAVLHALLGASGGKLLPARADLGRCALLGLLVSVHLSLQAAAMELTTAVRAGWIVAFIPVVVALGARVFLDQRLSAGGWIGAAVATSGVLVLSSFRPAELAQAGRGDLLVFASCFTWAAYTLLSVAAIRRSGALAVTAFAMAIAVAPAAAVALAVGSWHAAPSVRAVVALAFLGALASGVAFWAFARSIQELGPQRTSALLYIQPFVTLAGSALMLSEPITPSAVAGGVLVLLGVWRVQRARISAGAAK
jgi:drug/metabolite transporter (DMT)-like permease